MGSVRTVEGLRYSVYVVLLNPEVLNIPQIRRRNPKRYPLKPCVYVGLAGLRVDRCFDFHRVDAIADTWPSRKFGIRLMPELYEHLDPMPYEKRRTGRRNWRQI